jgi:hypothetical protein
MNTRFSLVAASMFLIAGQAFGQAAPPAKEPPPPQPALEPVQIAPDPQPRRVRFADEQLKTAEYQRAMAELALTQQAFADYKPKMEKASYIGLATSPVTTVLRDQLKLDKGTGLVVDRVESNSPAETAGMKSSDILLKLDDQVLINPHQFGILVRTLKPEQEAKLAIIRETKPMTISVKPVEKELAAVEEAAAYGVWRPATPKPVNNGQYTLTAKKGGGGGDVFAFVDQAEMVTEDNKMKIKTTTGPDGQRLTAFDKLTGKLIFDGAIDTDEQKQALPKEVADQLKAMEETRFVKPTPVQVMPGARGRTVTVRAGGAGNVLRLANANNLPKPKTVSGSDDDYTWEFSPKTAENGKAELHLLLLDKNGKILFDGPFSRTRDIPTLPATIAERLSTSPWDIMIEDLKSTQAGGGVLNVDVAPRGAGFGNFGVGGAGAAPGTAPPDAPAPGGNNGGGGGAGLKK